MTVLARTQLQEGERVCECHLIRDEPPGGTDDSDEEATSDHDVPTAAEITPRRDLSATTSFAFGSKRDLRRVPGVQHIGGRAWPSCFLRRCGDVCSVPLDGSRQPHLEHRVARQDGDASASPAPPVHPPPAAQATPAGLPGSSPFAEARSPRPTGHTLRSANRVHRKRRASERQPRGPVWPRRPASLAPSRPPTADSPIRAFELVRAAEAGSENGQRMAQDGFDRHRGAGCARLVAHFQDSVARLFLSEAHRGQRATC
jgi:hypothetical protein